LAPGIILCVVIRGDGVEGLRSFVGGGFNASLVPARAGSYSLAKSARATYAAATTPAATASGGRRSELAAEAGRSAFGGVAQRLGANAVPKQLFWVLLVSYRPLAHAGFPKRGSPGSRFLVPAKLAPISWT